jgi:hypothetical protein
MHRWGLEIVSGHVTQCMYVCVEVIEVIVGTSVVELVARRSELSAASDSWAAGSTVSTICDTAAALYASSWRREAE